MTVPRLHSNSLVRLAALAFVLPATVCAQPLVDGLVVFGDSLSDPGNVYVLTGEQSLAPFAPVPSAPYMIGGHHFTNGETWVEQLAYELSAPGGAGPALRDQRAFTNYAFGGARARSVGPFDLSAQVASYLASRGGAADAGSLFVVWAGPNDVRDALALLAVDPAGAGALIHDAAQALADNVQVLAGAGARTLLIPNSPNLALLPAVRALGPGAQAAALWLSMQYNGALELAIATLETSAPSLDIVYFDVFGLLNEVVATPEPFGLTNTEKPCLSFGVTGDFLCRDAQRYLFWDGVHPTRAAHAILAGAALDTL